MSGHLPSSSQRNYQTMPKTFPEDSETRILVIGKTGNGKSSICNTLLGERTFKTGRSMSSTTLQVQQAETVRHGRRIRVVDTPDVSNSGMEEPQAKEEVSKWKAMVSPHPSLVLLAVRCDVRYTKEEYDIYCQVLKLWGDKSLRERLVVAFTFGDRQDKDIGEELKTVCKELQSVLKDAKGRYVVFDNEADNSVKETAVQQVLHLTRAPQGKQQFPCGLPLVIALIIVAIVTIVLGILNWQGEVDLGWPAVGVGIAGIVFGLILLALFVAWIRFPVPKRLRS